MKKTRLRDHIYIPAKSAVHQIGISLAQYNINPTHLTLFGLLINILGCLLFAHGYFTGGALVILFAGLFDMLDGALARGANKVSKFGAFIDSVVDRYSDMLIFGSLAIFFARAADVNHVLLVLVVITGAFLTSYTKVRAESLIKRCDVGMVGRAERIIIIVIGGLFDVIVPALWILAFITHLTALDRIYYTWKQTEGGRREQDKN